MSDYTASNIAGVLSAVNARLAAGGQPFACDLGGAQAAAHASPPSVVWQPHPDMDVTFVPPTIQPADGEVIQDALEPYLVHVVGADVGSARRLVDVLLVALNDLFGIFAQRPIKMRPSPDRITSASFAYTLVVQLRIPVYRYRYGTATIETHEVDGVVQTQPPSTDPDADPGDTTEIILA